MNKYIVEFIGTFFLVLTVVLAANGAGAMAPIAIGSILMVMVYAGGHISGAHYNPAVTLAVFMRGKCDAKDVPMYIIAQLVAAVAAAFIGEYLLGYYGKGIAIPAASSLPVLPSIFAEVFGTFALVWVVLHTATTASTSGNSYYGLAIGFTVTACAYAFGAISGGAFNPAVATGVVTAGMVNVADIWIHLVSDFGAAALAAILFKMVYSGE